MSLVDRFIDWATSRPGARGCPRPVVTFDNKHLFDRWEFLRYDEWPDHFWDRARDKFPKRPHALPWWLPLNVFLHKWDMEPGSEEGFHDHPRWSVTICLKGRIIEKTPWARRELRPGSIVVRSRKAIHAFEMPPGAKAEVWTLFIVGRRKHRQNAYVVTAR